MLVTLDFETYYSREYSLTKLTTAEYILSPQFQPILLGLKIDDGPASWYADGQIDEVLASIDWRRAAVLAHNTRFDGAILKWRYNISPALYLDTMGMGQARAFAYSGSASLAKLCETLLGGGYTKGDEVHHALGFRREMFSSEHLARYGAYCCNDVNLTYTLLQVLKQNYPESEIHLIDALIRAFIDPAIQLDAGALSAHLNTVQTNKQNLLERLNLTTEQLRSDNTFAGLLIAHGVEPPTKISPATNEETWAFARTDEEFTKLLEDESETVQALVAARLGVKTTIEETRTQRLLTQAGLAGGMLPVPLKYYGAHTGRLAGTDKINLQNLGRKSPLRNCLIAPPGYALVSADASQIEARVLAWFAGQWDLVADFAAGRDVYIQFASRLYGLNAELMSDVTHPTERQVGKTGILGCGYGCGGDRFYGMLRTNRVTSTIDEAFRIVATYRSTYPAIPDLWQRGNELLRRMLNMTAGECFTWNEMPHWAPLGLEVTRESIRLPNGMHLYYRDLRQVGREIWYTYGRANKKIYGAKLIENLIQALARIIVLDLIHKLKGTNPEAKFALTIHDSLVYCIPDMQKEAFRKALVGAMSTPPAWGPEIPLAAKGYTGRTLAEAEGKA